MHRGQPNIYFPTLFFVLIFRTILFFTEMEKNV